MGASRGGDTDTGKTDWVKDLFTFREPGEDYALAAGKRAQRDIKDQVETREEKEKFRDTLKLMRSKKGLKKLKAKPLKAKAKDRHNNLVIYQCRTTDNTGRIWFLGMDEEPGAVAETLVILGCELRSHQKNSNRIKVLAKKCGFDNTELLFEVIEGSEDEELVINPGKSIELGLDYDIRPVINGLFDEITAFWTSQMGVRPTNDQLDTILKSNTPIFINGQAGTGKTIMLALRVALMHIDSNQQRYQGRGEAPRRTLVTSISEKVVDLLEEHVRVALNEVFGARKIGELVGGTESKEAGEIILTRARDSFDFSTQQGNKDSWMSSPDIDDFICFRTFRDIEMGILSPEKRIRFENPSKNVKFSKFSNEFFVSRRHLYGDLNAELAWFGIRSLIRGMIVVDSEHRFLNDDEVRQIISQHPKLLRDFHDSPSLVQSLIKCHDDYTNWLDEGHYYDDLDLARETWRTLNSKDRPSILSLEEFDEIYLDEAQDLTEIELRILLGLIRIKANSTDVIMAGDPLQTINPSGFSWSGLRSMIFTTLRKVAEEQIGKSSGEQKSLWELKLEEAAPPSPMNLNHNFRTPMNIVDVGNVILERRSYFQKDVNAEQSSSLVDGELKLLVIDPQHHSEPLTKLLTQEAERFVITRFSDREGVEDFVIKEQEIDVKDPKEAILYSITQVKGLEEEEIILYKMGESLISSKVNRILSGATREELSPEQKLKVIYELNKIYIGLTRSRRSMYIFENKLTAERLWSGSWFESVNIELVEDPKEVLDYLQQSWIHADQHTDHEKVALNLLEQFKQDPDLTKLNWAVRHAAKARDFPPRKLAEIKARLYREEARNLSGKEQIEKYYLAYKEFRDAGEPARAYDIVLDHLMTTTSGPNNACQLLIDRPNLSRPSGDPERDSESRFLMLLNSKGKKSNLDHHLSDLTNRPDWYDLNAHSDLLSIGIESILRETVGKTRVNHVKKIVDSKTLTRAQNEHWWNNLLPQIGPKEMWSSLSGTLRNHVSESAALRAALETSAEELLQTSNSLNDSIEIMKTWGDTNQSNAKKISERAVKLMLKREFENFTPSQLAKPKWPFILKHEVHTKLLDWAKSNDFNPSSRAVLLLSNIGGNHHDWPRINLAKLSGFRKCLESNRTELDEHIPSEATDATHLTKHLRELGVEWVAGQSKAAHYELTKQRTRARLIGLPYTDLWKECCGNRDAMSDLLWILFDSNPGAGNMNFCRQMMDAYRHGNQGESGSSSVGWAHFGIRFEGEAKLLMSEKIIISDELTQLLCEKGGGDKAGEISTWNDIHEDYRAFAEAYPEYVRERAQLSPDEIRELASKFEQLGYPEYSDNLHASLPTDLSSDIPAIVAKNIEAKTKVEQIIQKLLSAKGIEPAELKSVFQTHVLSNNTLRNALMVNLASLHTILEEFTQEITIDEDDEAILLMFKLSFFEFMFSLGEGRIKLKDETTQFDRTFIREKVIEKLSNLSKLDEAYRMASDYLLDVLWWTPPDTVKYKSVALLELFRTLELPQQTHGYLIVDDLVELRRSIGQDVSPADASALRPNQIIALLDEFEGDILYQNNPGLDEARSRLSGSN